MTQAQSRALSELYDDYCVDAGAGADWAASFGRAAPLAIEIGFGMGQALLDVASLHPEWNWVGIEVYRPGIGSLLIGCVERGMDTVRVVEGDARQSLELQFAQSSVHLINVFFPDPWPKKKHHKRRLVTPDFVDMAASRLIPGGRLCLATDWQAYSEVMLDVLEGCSELRNVAGPRCFASRPPQRPVTRFEARGQKLGHDVWDLAFERPGLNQNQAPVQENSVITESR